MPTRKILVLVFFLSFVAPSLSLPAAHRSTLDAKGGERHVAQVQPKPPRQQRWRLRCAGGSCGHRPELGAGVYQPCAHRLRHRRYAQRQPHMGRIPPKAGLQAAHGGGGLHHLLHCGRFCPGVPARRVCTWLLWSRSDRH